MEVSSEVRAMAVRAREAATALCAATTASKNAAIDAMASALCASEVRLLEANQADVAVARARGSAPAMVDRLMLSPPRIAAMADGLRQIAALPDPVGEVVEGWRRPNGLEILRVRVPIGVVGIIYESRPNVTADAAGLCLKAGNAVLLRGGSEALRSNEAIVECLAGAVRSAGLPQTCVQLVATPDREAAREMMRLNGLIDVLIPRGGAGLIRTVMENATVPVIETGTGNCHTFVDASADLEQALAIALNAKCSRPSVCNAMETLLVHEVIAEEFLPGAAESLRGQGVELRMCERGREIVLDAKPATEEDWATEFLDLTLAVKVVPDVGAAIAHIRQYGTRHSEAILTGDLESARRFTREVDAACVYVNASTRFTDGFEFGFGAEVGISNQKLHARGPMGLRELTTHKYIVQGEGHIRT
ncbi:MAG TPA: glutamate-5-semialdehyde dehydrogenase [Chthonomonadales bacterium]|nr:glutamate-5-semialdehyde dehydrogenase [Chthonomonadales bacterium]